LVKAVAGIRGVSAGEGGGGKFIILNGKFDFPHSANFKLMIHIKGYSINYCDF
jgi:hypothetical protein